nr:MAG TPA: hypothetical protein [Caudoviricetes sp.]
MDCQPIRKDDYDVRTGTEFLGKISESGSNNRA